MSGVWVEGFGGRRRAIRFPRDLGEKGFVMDFGVNGAGRDREPSRRVQLNQRGITSHLTEQGTCRLEARRTVYLIALSDGGDKAGAESPGAHLLVGPGFAERATEGRVGAGREVKPAIGMGRVKHVGTLAA